jgi:hypothetical protein
MLDSTKNTGWMFILIWVFAPVFAIAQTDTARSWGKASGQWRTHFMSTINKGELKDFSALATGGKLKYQHHFGKHVEVGTAFYSSFNLGISEMLATDPITGKPSRYEAGLFNVQDLSQREITLLGEAYLKFNLKQHEITIGRMKLETPLLNSQDGRMIPTLEQGIWYTQKPGEKLDIGVGIFNKIAPRATGKFYSIGGSIGTHAVGRNPDGSPSGYSGNTSSNFLAVGNVRWTPIKSISLKVADYWTENVFHTLYVEPAYDFDVGKKKLNLSAQWIHQNKLHEGGNVDPSNRYFSDPTANVYGLQLSLKGKPTVSVGYNRIAHTGRFLFPREWGREPLFTFQKRERTEGNANTHALLMTFEKQCVFSHGKLHGILSAGQYWKAPVTSAEDNKYALPDYTHVNLEFFYMPAHLKNLKPELLLAYKRGNGQIPDDPALFLNKIDMLHINLVVNYNF